MESSEAERSALSRKFEKVQTAPAGFELFVFIHDFVAHIESRASFDIFLKDKKASRTKEVPVKYFVLRQIYQGIEDIDRTTTEDLGHDRYVAIRELGQIRKKEASESNTFWRRREAVRKITGEVYKVLHAHLSQPA